MKDNSISFEGFFPPTENWSKLPHQFIAALPLIETIGEMKVILYVLRHTWGYHDAEKRITLDEFENGRKCRDGSRLDNGTGLSRNTIKDGIKRAQEHGFIGVDQDVSDRARIRCWYSLTSAPISINRGSTSDPLSSEVDPPPSKTAPRSEKDTLETNFRNNSTPPSGEEPEIELKTVPLAEPEREVHTIELEPEDVSIQCPCGHYQGWPKTETARKKLPALTCEGCGALLEVKGYKSYNQAPFTYRNPMIREQKMYVAINHPDVPDCVSSLICFKETGEELVRLWNQDKEKVISSLVWFGTYPHVRRGLPRDNWIYYILRSVRTKQKRDVEGDVLPEEAMPYDEYADMLEQPDLVLPE